METDNVVIRKNYSKISWDTTSTFSTRNRFLIKNQQLSTGRNLIYSVLSSTRINNLNRYSLDKLLLNKQKLRSLKFLQENWDGYNGKRFSSKIIDTVEDIVTKMEDQPQIFPTGRGSIQIEKYFDDNNLYEIEISDDEIYLYQVKNGIELEKEIKISELEKIISDFYD